MRTPLRVTCAAVALVIASTAVYAQTTTGSVTGSVKDEHGESVGGLVLLLEPTGGSANVSQKLKVNKKGRFAHRFLPTAKYVVTLEGSDLFIESMVYVIRDSTNLEVDRVDAKAHPEKGLPPIEVMAGQQGSLELVLASADYRAELSQKLGIAEASGDLQTASDLLNAGKTVESLEMANRLLEQKPDLGPALYLRGAAQFSLGNLEEAEADLRRAVELIPDQAGVYSTLGDVLLMRGDTLRKEEATKEAATAMFGEAADLFANELERDPAAEQVLRNRLIALKMAGRNDELGPALEKLIELSPEDTEAYLQLAEMAAAAGDHEKALSTLERIPGKGAEAVGAMFNLAVGLYNESRYEEAVPIVERALAVDPEFPELHRLLAGIKLVQGDREAAIAGLERYLELADPDRPDVAQARQLLDALKAQGSASADQ